jgi:hypothetical protein
MDGNMLIIQNNKVKNVLNTNLLNTVILIIFNVK